MKSNRTSGIVACTGAVIGAGFASGREVVAFFSRYHGHAPWLIALSAATAAGLCGLCVRRASRLETSNWCELYAEAPVWMRWGAFGCAALLLAVTGGAMISAAGHMIALLWENEWAYPIGAVGTLYLAWKLSFGSMKPLAWLSGALTMVFVTVTALLLLSSDPQAVDMALQPAAGTVVWAAARAVAYAAMNLTQAEGEVCRCRQETARGGWQVAGGLGAVLCALLMLSALLYAKHPELQSEAFPIVKLMSRFGRAGFTVSATMLYLAVLTSLVAVLCALRGIAELRVRPAALRAAAALGTPLVISCVGFEGIVDGLYAPAGFACLVLVFGPLIWLEKKRRQQS